MNPGHQSSSLSRTAVAASQGSIAV